MHLGGATQALSIEPLLLTMAFLGLEGPSTQQRGQFCMVQQVHRHPADMLHSSRPGSRTYDIHCFTSRHAKG